MKNTQDKKAALSKDQDDRIKGPKHKRKKSNEHEEVFFTGSNSQKDKKEQQNEVNPNRKWLLKPSKFSFMKYDHCLGFYMNCCELAYENPNDNTNQTEFENKILCKIENNPQSTQNLPPISASNRSRIFNESGRRLENEDEKEENSQSISTPDATHNTAKPHEDIKEKSQYAPIPLNNYETSNPPKAADARKWRESISSPPTASLSPAFSPIVSEQKPLPNEDFKGIYDNEFNEENSESDADNSFDDEYQEITYEKRSRPFFNGLMHAFIEADNGSNSEWRKMSAELPIGLNKPFINGRIKEIAYNERQKKFAVVNITKERRNPYESQKFEASIYSFALKNYGFPLSMNNFIVLVDEQYGKLVRLGKPYKVPFDYEQVNKEISQLTERLDEVYENLLIKDFEDMDIDELFSQNTIKKLIKFKGYISFHKLFCEYYTRKIIYSNKECLIDMLKFKINMLIEHAPEFGESKNEALSFLHEFWNIFENENKDTQAKRVKELEYFRKMLNCIILKQQEEGIEKYYDDTIKLSQELMSESTASNNSTPEKPLPQSIKKDNPEMYKSKKWFNFLNGFRDLGIKSDEILNSKWCDDGFHGILPTYKQMVSALKEFISNADQQALRDIIINNGIPPPSSLKKDDIKMHLCQKYWELIKKLNEDQQEALFKFFTCCDCFITNGYPGSGKSTFIAAILKIIKEEGKKALVCSFTNNSLDNLLLKLSDCIDGVYRYLRKEAKNSAFRQKYSDKCGTAIGSNVKILGTTVYGAWHARNEFEPDYIIIDEASLIAEPACIIPLLFYRGKAKFMLVGDRKQLGPIFNTTESQNNTSLFVRLKRNMPEENKSKLTIQYRMNADLYKIAKKLYSHMKCGTYENDQTPHSNEVRFDHLSEMPLIEPWIKEIFNNKFSAILLNTHEDISKSARVSKKEIKAIREMITFLNDHKIPENLYQVLATYNDQCSAFKTEANYDSALTIDKSQGLEWKAVMISLVNPTHEKMFPDKRISVMLTRAKTKLILVGDLVKIKKSNFWEYIKDNVRIVEYPN